MKVLGSDRHSTKVDLGLQMMGELPAIAASARPTLDFAKVYEGWFDEVVRWIRALGAPESDRQDLAQEVFCVVQRKLISFRGENLPGWLYGIARRVVKDHRRLRWFRHLYLRPREVVLDDLRSSSPSAEDELARRQDEQLLFRLLDKMSDKRRTAFVLFEIEEYTGEQIAALEGIPLSTVWTRLHHARRDYVEIVERYQRKEGLR